MPEPLSAVDSIGPAFEQTKRQLFVPFRFRRWACLAVVLLSTGEFAGGARLQEFQLPPAVPRLS